MAKKTWWQQQQEAGKAAPAAPVEKLINVPSWLKELIAILEAIWAALPASQSEPNHPVAKQLAAFKAKLPE
jgi:hypothetical protein